MKSMKRLLSVLFVLALAASLFAMPASAADEVSTAPLKVSFDKETNTVTVAATGAFEISNYTLTVAEKDGKLTIASADDVTVLKDFMKSVGIAKGKVAAMTSGSAKVAEGDALAVVKMTGEAEAPEISVTVNTAALNGEALAWKGAELAAEAAEPIVEPGEETITPATKEGAAEGEAAYEVSADAAKTAVEAANAEEKPVTIDATSDSADVEKTSVDLTAEAVAELKNSENGVSVDTNDSTVDMPKETIAGATGSVTVAVEDVTASTKAPATTELVDKNVDLAYELTIEGDGVDTSSLEKPLTFTIKNGAVGFDKDKNVVAAEGNDGKVYTYNYVETYSGSGDAYTIVGNDLVIYTTHLTTFMVLSDPETPAGDASFDGEPAMADSGKLTVAVKDAPASGLYLLVKYEKVYGEGNNAVAASLNEIVGGKVPSLTVPAGSKVTLSLLKTEVDLTDPAAISAATIEGQVKTLNG